MSIDVHQIQQALNDSKNGTWGEVLDDTKYFDGVYLFFSFDLVNSTAFKTQYNGKWKTVFTRFYELVASKLVAVYKNISIWKYIGDEVLLYLKVSHFEEVYDAPINALKIIKEVTRTLNKEIKESKNRLFLKAVLWIAKVNFLDPNQDMECQSHNYKNIAFSSGDLPDWLDRQRIDFLGPDIDLGFRLSAYTQKAQLLISAELAYILHRKNGEINRHGRKDEYKYKPNDCCKIITLEKLKGIWNNRRYPIIWFHTDWAFDRMFDYDEHIESDLVQIVKEDKAQNLEDLIEKIFTDLDKIDEMEEIICLIEHYHETPVQPLVKYRISKDKLAEVYCAAACFTKDGKLMIAKRSSNKILKGIWEFGCGHLEMNQDIKNCLLSHYKKDFKADLLFLKDKPIPVSTYSFTVTEEERIVPGILFFAIIENPEYVSENFNKDTHDEIRWLPEEELKTISSECAIEHFHESSRLAFTIYKTYNFYCP